MELVTSTDLRKQIQGLVNDSSVEAVAGRFGVTIPYIYMVLSGQRQVSRTLAESLGYAKVSTPKPEAVFVAVENSSVK